MGNKVKLGLLAALVLWAIIVVLLGGLTARLCWLEQRVSDLSKTVLEMNEADLRFLKAQQEINKAHLGMYNSLYTMVTGRAPGDQRREGFVL